MSAISEWSLPCHAHPSGHRLSRKRFSALESTCRDRHAKSPPWWASPQIFHYAALKGMTLLSFATHCLVGICPTRGPRSEVRYLLFPGSRLAPLGRKAEGINCSSYGTLLGVAASESRGQAL